MPNNLFNKAKEKSEKTTKKTEKLKILINGEQFDKDVIDLYNIENQIKNLTEELDGVKTRVKEVGVKTFENIYDENKEYPGSFTLFTDSDASVMIVPSDKYLKCDEVKFNNLKNTYGDDIVTEKTEYFINPILLEKYADIISNFIEMSEDITDEDKLNIIQAKVSRSVSSGAIEKAFTLGNGDVSNFINDIQPVFTLKSVKVSN